MTPNSLSPAFVRIEYQTLYAPHTMTIPSVPLIDAIDPEEPPFFDLRGAAIDVQASDAVEDFVDVLKNMCTLGTSFQSYTIFKQPTPEDVPQPVYSAALTQVGVLDNDPLSKAMQQTFSFRATDFTIYKLVVLDQRPMMGTGRVVGTLGNLAYQAVVDYIKSDVTWFASRGGGRPATFLQLATTLNEKLRRSYRMN